MISFNSRVVQLEVEVGLEIVALRDPKSLLERLVKWDLWKQRWNRSSGETGEKEDTGNVGQQGPAGAQGSKGPRGIKGSIGVQGAKR